MGQIAAGRRPARPANANLLKLGVINELSATADQATVNTFVAHADAS